jgi:hypothetical protein
LKINIKINEYEFAAIEFAATLHQLDLNMHLTTTKKQNINFKKHLTCIFDVTLMSLFDFDFD